MIESVRKTLARLDAVNETVFRSPMTEEELQVLERAVGLPVPACLREYFRLVGLTQDLTRYEASEYELLDRIGSFVTDRKSMLKMFPEAAKTLFPFAGDGAGDFIAVAEGKDCSKMFFADHETKKIREIGPFCGWLSRVVDSALKQPRPPNGRKRRYVQFSFTTSTSEPILEILNRFDRASLGPWTTKGRSPTGVESARATLTFGTEQLALGKSEYWTWTTPMFSLNYEEGANVRARESRLWKLDAAFRDAGFNYRLVDYGVMDSEAVQKAKNEAESREARQVTPTGSTKKKWWQRFW